MAEPVLPERQEPVGLAQESRQQQPRPEPAAVRAAASAAECLQPPEPIQQAVQVAQPVQGPGRLRSATEPVQWSVRRRFAQAA
jgi:hypothetical protein